MCLTKNNSELWVSSGKLIIIINPDTLETIDRLEGARMAINSMVTDDKYVWISERNLATITQFDVETRQKVHKFTLNAENLLNFNIYSLSNDANIDRMDASGEQVVDSERSSESLPYKDEGELLNSNVLMKASLCKKPSLSDTTFHISDQRNNLGEDASTSVHYRKPTIHNLNISKIRSLLYHQGMLYVGRGCGDILIVNVNDKTHCTESNVSASLGKVVAQFTVDMGYEDFQKSITSLLLLDNQQIISSVRMEPSRSKISNIEIGRTSRQIGDTNCYHLFVFQVWGEVEFEEFYRKVS